jgi:hypothetical protein
MAPWFHSVVLATTLIATVAVGVASASMFLGSNEAAPKADRLPLLADSSRYVTVETRGDNVSTLHKVQID